MRPYDVKMENDILRMTSDNFPAKSNVWSILNHENKVSLHAPAGKGWVEIPRDQFNAIVDWYMKDQAIAHRKEVDHDHK